jgi:hypothetical protein
VFVGIGLADSEWRQPTQVSNALGQPNTNEKSPQVARPNVLSPELQEIEWARGSFKTENAMTAPTTPTPTLINYYGYDSDVRNAEGEPAMLPLVAPAPGSPSEATKTEPDKNVYLRLQDQKGADPTYDYGTHFLFQGHENGTSYVTRINLDADGKHRVTLIAASMNESKGTQPLPLRFDGITWDPFAKRLLGAFEDGASGGVVQFTATFPSQASDLFASMGRGGYEGIQNDSRGNVYIAEDVGGPSNGARRAPNSFIYRFVPTQPGDLEHGKLQALQVLNKAGTPITFESQLPPANPDQNELHAYGNVLKTKWVTIHDTESTVTLPSLPSAPWPNANAAAKAAHATPFKRPENGVFRPGTKFAEFYFAATGDTNALSTDNDPPATPAQVPGVPPSTTIPAATGSGGWGTVFKLVQSPTGSDGTITPFYKGDVEHTGMDNIQFVTANKLTFVEDAGDTVHTQRKKFDSGFILDTNVNYATGAQPVRWLAEGRDASATLDSQQSGVTPGFRNDGDNEITGAHVSDGDPGIGGILGAKLPTPFQNGWRWFWTQQHGDNVTYEVIPSPRFSGLGGEGDENDDSGSG